MSVIGCRNCRRPVWFTKPSDAPFFPFCSERCKMADLGKWFAEEHRIPTPADDADIGRPGRTDDPPE